MNKKLTVKKPYMFISAVLSVVLLTGCLVPDNNYLMELNRSGKWMEVEKVGLSMLSNRKTFTHSQICETYFHVIYAQTRLGKEREARSLMEEYDSLIGQEVLDSEFLWLHREIASLKDELGLLDEIERTLLQSMEENGQGNFERAREMARQVASEMESSDQQKAVAHFIASVCSMRLRDIEAAEHHFVEYKALKEALPPGHQIHREEELLIEGINAFIGDSE